MLLKIDDVRLLESRKSARLVNSDTDFSKLNDVVISTSSSSSLGGGGGGADGGGGGGGGVSGGGAERKGSKAIEVPRSEYVQIAGYGDLTMYYI